MAPIFFLIAACPVVSLIDDAAFDRLFKSIDGLTREKQATIEAQAGKTAFLAEQVYALVDLLGRGTERNNAFNTLFPYIVDKENLPQHPRLFIQSHDRIDGAQLVVRPLALSPLVPVVCIALHPISATALSALADALRAESLARKQLQLLRRNLRDYLFTTTDAERLLALISFRQERWDAGHLLKPRIMDRAMWDARVCRTYSDWSDCKFAPE